MTDKAKGELATRIAVVTGASSGIGRATALELAARGCRVVINSRRSERLAEVAKEIDSSFGHGRAAMTAGDCADQATIDLMLDTARLTFGREADLVVVNAGRGLNGSVMTSNPAQWEEMVRTNLLGAARLMRSAGERMLKDVASRFSWLDHPHDIIAIGSVVGRHVSPFSSMYGSTKFGVHGLAEGQRRELAGKGIRITLVEPGFVVSEFQQVAGYDDQWFKGRQEALGPMLDGADVGRAVAYIATQPPHVHVSDILIRPTRQDYP